MKPFLCGLNSISYFIPEYKSGIRLMSRRTFSGKEVIKVLYDHGFLKVNQTGSHVKLKYTHPKTGETRTVIVPEDKELSMGTLREIAHQAGANDFQAFLDWMEETLDG